MKLEDLLLDSPALKQWFKGIKIKNERHLVTGLLAAAKPLFIASLFKRYQKTILLVSDSLHHAQLLERALSGIVGSDNVYLYPVEEATAAEVAVSSPEYRGERVAALTALCAAEPRIVLASAKGMKRLLPPRAVWQNAKLEFNVGQEIELEQVAAQLSLLGFERHKLVDKPGDFAIRGSIIDIYPLNLGHPLRIDLFDNEIDSLREFAPDTQRSLKNIEHAIVLPATDLILPAQLRPAALEKIKVQYQADKQAVKEQTALNNLKETYRTLHESISTGQLQPAQVIFTDQLYPTRTALLDYLNSDGFLLVDDYPRVLESERMLDEENMLWKTEQLKSGGLFSKENWENQLRPLLKGATQTSFFFSLFEKGMGQLTFNSKVDLKVRAVQQFFGQMPLLKTELERWKKQKQTVVFALSTQEQIEKFMQTLDDFEVSAILTKADSIQPHRVQVILDNIENGFEFPQGHAVVLTAHEILKKVIKHRPQRQTMENTERLRSYTELKQGDYVVHLNHGIGKYEGMKTMEVGGKHQDYLTITYRDNAKLFLPVSQIDRIQKYVSSESRTPRINKLGGSEWVKTKKNVAAKIEDIADDLIELYAQRKTQKGYSFSPDNEYQHEFEEAFPYTETPDQLRSALEIKRDMQKARPMDRLLIGDVGYGKTEVALRAAFKAIQDQKQVAFLVPTTVLAQQHYETMINRFDEFPVEVGILSRFRTQKQISQTLMGLKNGTVDIVVGTHRLLSKDIHFADLGLLIIDEEQRFGVKHKERLKQLRSKVDVLTLTATPIPRTLNMSMLGVRDLSVIETAPMNRYPIQTYVMEQNYGTVADAISRELARGGQVFYLHNRVSDIEKVVAEIRTFVPEARVAYIHGQMTEFQLEQVLYDFIAGEYDVLVTTTIIETGVDIPNVNTLIVEDADHMGLAQLYQLRGRVGRSNRVAYAYFMYQPNKVLTEVSEKRLEAIKDFTELGSGFKIAMRDLSIRGAGNLLGKQQHGFIDSVGYDLYTQMLKDAIAKKQGKQKIKQTDAEISLELEAYLPSTYLEDQRQKIEVYKRIRQLENEDQYREVQSDLIDRFGEYPPEVENLLQIGLLKMYADRAQVETISQNGKQLKICFAAEVSQQLKAPSFLKALSYTKLKASLKVVAQKMQLGIVLQPRDDLQSVIADLQVVLNKIMEYLNESKESDYEKANGKSL
ncbi:transcription-repair coupling factor [Liquorilactobacillus satsumensis]|uniref:Transcription-repair-coupling factor n=1 Tax=Liquorilactobacillus satsumensis DSM 16230 = JCM 12392 TaxID=1423801 RepID=A0A0R1V375_9LACO|nr:transcription-repair coupling factor [Liquorilactobacillus satsumensis]KRM00029.1 transcription-repair coupling factor [Liquorilactobacillus satsumensis DSM 16230 = JCM 12392]MCP9313600.1 transcription-repair coupling factor [Liquorilactobacillus satsumensis]MCP9360734.1 transcription-repair coupling factor [Liquorilactobacillus satsumensis]